ncbi:Hypothetical predicted protein [Pelobates cultripes]|uniref:Uncharacterized protein n=1 Tax=Pelobates cultripes TaxID=61616 RepID=A0AAD1WVU5_PELCU|nr:Hypothetical predicted protein [Pelobates cultripes]
MTTTSPAGSEKSALEKIGDELRSMAANMVTKANLHTLTATIQDTLRAEMAGIRAEVATLVGRMAVVQETTEALEVKLTTTDTAVTRQGALLLAMRRHLEDLNNRGRRYNIRVRGVPETDRDENAGEVLAELFQAILHMDTPQQIEFERAHRALRPRSLEEGPRDLICCLHSFPVKDAIMKKARERPTWPYRGAQVSLYNDLFSITLEARRALRPVTSALRNNNVTYKWGLPFALTQKRMDLPAVARRSTRIHGREPTPVPNWILDPQGPPPRPQRAPRRRNRRNPSGGTRHPRKNENKHLHTTAIATLQARKLGPL